MNTNSQKGHKSDKPHVCFTFCLQMLSMLQRRLLLKQFLDHRTRKVILKIECATESSRNILKTRKPMKLEIIGWNRRYCLHQERIPEFER